MAEASVEAKPFLQFQRTILSLQLAMIVVICFLYLGQGHLPGIVLLGLTLLTLFLWLMGDRSGLLNFGPFLLMLLTYESIRGLVQTSSNGSIHVMDMILWDKSLSGGILPTYFLQRTLSAQPFTWIVDAVANGFYMTHFISAIALGLLLWTARREHYWPYLLGLAVLSYAAFLTYVFFPAAPPWWASMYGYLKGEAVDLSHSLLSPGYIVATGNPVASMPSLHAAYPFYMFFYCLYIWGKKSLPVLILPLGVAASSIYLGHHYVIDILVGVVYALVAFLCTVWWSRTRMKLNPQEQTGALATA